MDESEMLKRAWDALLRGDTAERDRICTFLQRRQEVRGRTAEEIEMHSTIKLERQPDGSYAPEKRVNN